MDEQGEPFIPDIIAREACKKLFAGRTFELPKLCEWRQNEIGDWKTDCCHWEVWNGDIPSDIEYVFCPYCGRKIKEKRRNI
jgi:hypothetical protein